MTGAVGGSETRLFPSQRQRNSVSVVTSVTNTVRGDRQLEHKTCLVPSETGRPYPFSEGPGPGRRQFHGERPKGALTVTEDDRFLSEPRSSPLTHGTDER